MKRLKELRIFSYFLLLSVLSLSIASCSDDDNSTRLEYGKVVGTVTDEQGAALGGVAVTISGVEGSVTSNADGTYSFENVSIDKHAVTFSKTEYLTTSGTILSSDFESSVATKDMSLREASGKVYGVVLDGKNNNVPLTGVTVKLGNETVVTGEDGKYLFENLLIEDYTLQFSKQHYVNISRTIKEGDFVNNSAELQVRLGGVELLPGMTIDDLKLADKWLFNDYKGGGFPDYYPRWCGESDFLCTFTFWGNFEEQNEGTTLRIRNEKADQSNPKNLDVFDSFTYGSKKITEDNKILSIRMRTHNASSESPAYFGVQVIDLSAENPIAEKVGDTKTYGSADYADFDFDLSKYIDKEVIIVVGIYRADTGDYWKQFVIRSLRFAPTKVSAGEWLSGTDVPELTDWRMTLETVRSTMVQTQTKVTGFYKPGIAGWNNYPESHRTFKEFKSIPYYWTIVPLQKAAELYTAQGYLIKTRGDGPINTKTPEAYIYSKFAIDQGNNQLTIGARTFGSNFTFFKVTAITEDGVATHILPKTHKAVEEGEAKDGCWKFKNDKGDPNSIEAYATFEYDLSQYNGKNVMITISVHNGESNGDENKLAFSKIELN